MQRLSVVGLLIVSLFSGCLERVELKQYASATGKFNATFGCKPLSRVIDQHDSKAAGFKEIMITADFEYQVCPGHIVYETKPGCEILSYDLEDIFLLDFDTSNCLTFSQISNASLPNALGSKYTLMAYEVEDNYVLSLVPKGDSKILGSQRVEFDESRKITSSVQQQFLDVVELSIHVEREENVRWGVIEISQTEAPDTLFFGKADSLALPFEDVPFIDLAVFSETGVKKFITIKPIERASIAECSSITAPVTINLKESSSVNWAILEFSQLTNDYEWAFQVREED